MIAHRLNGRFSLQPGQKRRRWMDESPKRYAYHCLPLVVANEAGFDLRLRESVEATWNGGPYLPDVEVSGPARSNFGQGIVTFHVDAIFRTPPGVQLIVMGPANEPKDGIQPLVGIVETSWAVATFTMNWMFTRPGTARWHPGDVYCKVIPAAVLGLPAGRECDQRDIGDNPGLERQYRAWAAKRAGWDGHSRDLDYRRGGSPGGEQAPAGEHFAGAR